MATEQPPGINRTPDVHERLVAAYAAKGPAYVARTHLIEAGRARYVNALIHEASPYLLQHAHNPVDWRPWSDETLAEATARNMPIFLSVGYATCHWCHVMEEESFDNETVAAVLNTYFIPVKMDREQRPDLDHIYITATQLQQGHAGWPNSVFLMPDGRPFHTGTYFPPEAFLQIVSALGDAWRDPDRRAEIEAVATRLSEAVQRITRMRSTMDTALDAPVFERAVTRLEEMHNALQGGFSDSQQFPQEGFLLFLMDHWRRTGDARAREMALSTLDAIAAGGIHDHVGGGFHRYAVDPNWRTPHFEKMLYNQGQLSRAFVAGWEMTGAEPYRRAAQRTFDYVLRDMTDMAGAFYAAEDADSLDPSGQREEGAFYVWTPAEAGAEARVLLGLDQPATMEAGAVAHLDPTVAADFAALDPVLERLRVLRDARPRPLRDDKVIAGWNGLMIRALAEGGEAFGDARRLEQASRAAEAVWNRLWTGQRLARLWVGGEAREEATLDDYAWLGLGLVALADATGTKVWLERAKTLGKASLALFADGTGRLRMAAADGPLGPIYDSADGAVPSGESAMLELLTLLARRTGDLGFEDAALSLRAALSGPLAEQPLMRPDALTASRLLDMGESGARRTIGPNAVRILAGQDALHLRIAPGWHVNAHEPGQDWLVGATLDGAEAAWPGGTPLTAAFADGPVHVYEGHVSVPLATQTADVIDLTVQVCSDTVCLEPETLRFRR